MDILIGLAIVALVVIGAYVATHHAPPATPSAKDLVNTLASSADASWTALKRDLPALVSAENAQLKADLAGMEDRAKQAEAKLVVEAQARLSALAAVKDQVTAVIAGIGAQPASALAAPLVAAAQAKDAATVLAFVNEISPTSPTSQR
jgi:hypothetical protein